VCGSSSEYIVHDMQHATHAAPAKPEDCGPLGTPATHSAHALQGHTVYVARPRPQTYCLRHATCFLTTFGTAGFLLASCSEFQPSSPP
jgi:hypothetical protein